MSTVQPTNIQGIPGLGQAIVVGQRALAGAQQAAPVVADQTRQWANDTYQFGQNAASRVAQSPQVSTWKLLWHAFRSHERTLMPGKLPAYVPLDPALRQQAQAEGANQVTPQPMLTDEQGHLHEPVNLVVRGSKEQLEKALKSQGWQETNSRSAWAYIRMGVSLLTRAWNEGDSPVSRMFLNGQSEVMAFNKNSDHTLARDHMRVYYQGKDPQTGQDVWAIASTRDVAATVTFHPLEKQGFWPWQWHVVPPSFGHETDSYVDGERDLIMNDLLKSGRVAGWDSVNGQRPDGYAGRAQADGLLKVGRYTTDGQVYRVSL